jgi:hypothetical protein
MNIRAHEREVFSMYNFLIQESAFSAAPVIQKKNSNTVEFIAVLQEADKPNRNGRIYYKKVLEEALQSPYVQERLRTNSFYGECGHPTDTSVQRQMTIDQRNIAFLIKEFWWDGNLLKARVETANTSIGRDMKGLIEQGSRVAFSLRAQGNVHHDSQLNATIVESPIQIATYDWVVNPSHDKAFMETICEETRCSMFGVKESRSLVLAESVKLFESGRMIALNEVTKPVVHDYAKNYWKKVKPLAEAYVYDPKDKLVVAEKVATVQNDNVTKKVVLEDYLLKDIRHRIVRLTEEGEAAAQPVATSDAPAKELTPEVTQAEVHAGEQAAEEVKPVVVEALSDKERSETVSDAAQFAQKTKTPSKDTDYFSKSAEKSRKISKEDFGKHYTDPKEEKMARDYFEDSAEKKEIYTDQLKQKTGIKFTESEQLGDAAAQPVATSDAPAKEHTPVVKKEDIHTSQTAEEIKSKITEAAKPFTKDDTTPVAKATEGDIVKLKKFVKETGKGKVDKNLHEEGEAAAQPVATSDAPAKEHTPEAKKEDIHTSQSAEEVSAPTVNESKKLPEALKGNTFDDPKDADKVPEKLEKKALKEEGEAAAQPIATSDEKPVEHTPEAKKEDIHTSQSAEEVKAKITEEVEGEVAEAEEIVKDVEEKHDVDTNNDGKIGDGTAEVDIAAVPDVLVSDESVRIEIPLAGAKVKDSLSSEEVEAISEALRQVHLSVIGDRKLNEETAEISTDAEADVKVEGDKLVVEIEIKNPEEKIGEEDGQKLAEAVSAIAFILTK